MKSGQNLPHIVLNTPPETSLYTSTSTGGSKKTGPTRDRFSHGSLLKTQLDGAWKQSESEQATSHITRSGVYLEFRSDPGFNLELQSLEDVRKGVRLLNVRKQPHPTITELSLPTATTEEDSVYATVYVPNAEKKFFLNKIEKYLNKDTKNGKPCNAPLIESIADIRKALLIESFWSDDKKLIPQDTPEWIEVWLSTDQTDEIKIFEQLLTSLEIQSRSGFLRFPERSVKVIFADSAKLSEITKKSDLIAEYRRAKSTAAFWLNSNNSEQTEWIKNLLGRINVDEDTNSSVCILDTGINYGHPLLSPILKEEDCLAVDSEWGVHDHDKHGTLMAGLAAYGNLHHALETRDKVDLNHRIGVRKNTPTQ